MCFAAVEDAMSLMQTNLNITKVLSLLQIFRFFFFLFETLLTTPISADSNELCHSMCFHFKQKKNITKTVINSLPF